MTKNRFNFDFYGGRGSDTIKGGGGADLLSGERGDDRLIGGGGKDSFEFGQGYGQDRIADWTDNTDTLALDDALLPALAQYGLERAELF